MLAPARPLEQIVVALCRAICQCALLHQGRVFDADLDDSKTGSYGDVSDPQSLCLYAPNDLHLPPNWMPRTDVLDAITMQQL
jgi:hypothetical protein